MSMKFTFYFRFFSTQYLSHPEKYGCATESVLAILFRAVPDRSTFFTAQLTVVEDNLIEPSDFFEEEGIRQPTDLIEHMRAEVRQLRVHLDFISSLRLLQACRQLQQHLQRHGRLPLFDLNFG